MAKKPKNKKQKTKTKHGYCKSWLYHFLVPVPRKNTEVPITDTLDLDSDGLSFGQHLPLVPSDVIIEYKGTWLSYLLRKFCETEL